VFVFDPVLKLERDFLLNDGNIQIVFFEMSCQVVDIVVSQDGSSMLILVGFFVFPEFIFIVGVDVVHSPLTFLPDKLIL
jgi:hypothetical protein